MKIKEISTVLEAAIIAGEQNRDIEIDSACGADLMSDVMAFVKENVVLLTGLINLQVVRTAEMMDIKVIVFVRGKNPSQEIIDLANEKGITILTTKYSMFIACGKLYEAGITGRGGCC
ncbi:DRTGG domain-containing protein [Pseudobacteroides cellulosolvens]|uniref:DRTGG domain-containing protein n=1 Tax=Pseudobacteroides cellulosolvens TaxID=35825 RepID=UPI00055DA3A2|nr:DRTGG domain-containing protein [Pseudobacteroides cellulosolvens]